MEINLGFIVEGHGEVDAVPILIRRILAEIDSTISFKSFGPIRRSRNALVKEGELEKAVETTARGLGGAGAILILLDGDEDCPAKLGPRLKEIAQKTRPDIPIGVVLAKREFESWFIAAIESLRGVRGIPNTIEAPPNPEGIQGAKEWLKKYIGKYSPKIDQPKLTNRFNLQLARQRSDSFDKCFREVERLVFELLGLEDSA